jgi:putative transcriptional regulator
MNKTAFERIKSGLEEALAIAKGEADTSTYVVHLPEEINVRQICMDIKLSQAEFAARYGFGLASVRDWEQGRSRPVGPVRAYLLVIKREREAVDRALRAA